MNPFELFIIAFVTSLIPILAWLWFLEHEDKHPEPIRLTLYAFIGGMAATIAVIPFEQAALNAFGITPVTFFVWAGIEEIMKLFAASILVLNRMENDEPIDSMMYMIATALGFATLENTLYIFHPLLIGNTFLALKLSSFRFFGATILHTIASSVIGACLALSYYKEPRLKKWYVLFGILIATTLHATFNLSIIYLDESRASVAFYGVWIVFVGVLLLFEKVKNVTNPQNNNQT